MQANERRSALYGLPRPRIPAGIRLLPVPGPPRTRTPRSLDWIAANPSTKPVSEAASRIKTLRILVVEDEMLISMLLTEVLEGLGHNVCGIEDTELGAVAAAARLAPDLMIVDVWLDEGNGVAAMAEIFRIGPMPHFFISADRARVRVLKPDAEVMQKPFRERDLVQAISRARDTAARN